MIFSLAQKEEIVVKVIFTYQHSQNSIYSVQQTGRETGGVLARGVFAYHLF